MSGVITAWVVGDQLLDQHPAVLHAEALAGSRAQVRVLLIESHRRLRTLRYQRKKLVLLLSAMRHYAAALRSSGFVVDVVQAASFVDGLSVHVARHDAARVVTMASASFYGRRAQRGLEAVVGVPVEVLPNTQFLVERFNPIPEPAPGKRYVMEGFYRAMRKHYDVLMEDGQPVGGQWNYDKENRKKLPRNVTPPADLCFEPDAITRDVMAEVAEIDGGVGTVDGFGYAVTRAQALKAADVFFAERLMGFGPYEDALTTRSHTVFHSVLSPYLNIGLLEPLELIQMAEAALSRGEGSIASVEGFVRQILGWREFMYWQYWRQMPGMLSKNSWDAQRSLPEFVWTGETSMRCISFAVKRALETGYNHHIERLMVLSNFFMLAGIEPRQVNDWFLSVYIDAYAWVMPPNVIGMSLNADGGLTATKPYISSANYIHKMGDLCGSCEHDRKARHGDKACPFNFLYWNFILQHETRLRANPRTGRSVLGLRHLDEDERVRVRAQAAEFLKSLEPHGPQEATSP